MFGGRRKGRLLLLAGAPQRISERRRSPSADVSDETLISQLRGLAADEPVRDVPGEDRRDVVDASDARRLGHQRAS